jgi:hypothetical protein
VDASGLNTTDNATSPPTSAANNNHLRMAVVTKRSCRCQGNGTDPMDRQNPQPIGCAQP